MKRVAALYRYALSLRYRVHLEGTGVLLEEGTKLLLPNHQALVDPQILYAHVYRYLVATPLMSVDYFEIRLLQPLFKRLGAIPVPNLERGRAGVAVAAGLHERVLEALQEGKHVLLYPAGQIAAGGSERIRNKQVAWQVCRRLPAGTRVIGVRVRGLWGSMWSRAGNGKSPHFLPTYLKGIFYVLVNFVFLLPRRAVLISFHDITGEALEEATRGRAEFNAFLETFYNSPAPDSLVRVRHLFWQRGRRG
ncbi:MAG: 1-acyl-sn-glycerol-3-phosphate acyltransferase [Odoribacteraceae bacterium]|jgi:long-chain-fatty-acid--[acyl-carrier-protein] ligase|nr:1-acyl-sn-glycerol-3-phosphate acyltransferase [Odoribacteraceae bacterium]